MQENQTAFRPSRDRRRILLIEDEYVNQEILKMFLEDSYDLVVAGTGTEALNIIRSQYEMLSLILLDLNLPDLSGLDILRQVKADSRTARLPVIVATSDGDAEVECLTLGAIDFISKPYPRQEVVLARVLRTIELSEDRDTLSLTERDHLTGLYNKEFFNRYAAQLDIHHRDCPMDAIVLNVNQFHMINDRYGKVYGDEVLRLIAEKILELVEQSGGIAGRSEADNFWIYCPQCADYGATLEAVQGDLNGDGQSENRIRLRMGVMPFQEGMEVVQMFDRARTACSMARGNFKEHLIVYDEAMQARENYEQRLLNDLHRALNSYEFEVHYQPQYDIQSTPPKLVSAEALVRWKHPELGMIPPNDFVPLFERHGKIGEVDRYVWSEAARAIARWRDLYGVTIPVSVNLSRVDVFDPALESALEKLLAYNGLQQGMLKLEVTESAYTGNADQVIQVVEGLRRKGYIVEMDDFGTGYSSLNMLSAMPVDVLKMDREFIRRITDGEKDASLVALILGIAKSLKIPVVAEGVETEEQLNLLRKLGCPFVQGFYFSKPLPADEFEKKVIRAMQDNPEKE